MKLKLILLAAVLLATLAAFGQGEGVKFNQPLLTTGNVTAGGADCSVAARCVVAPVLGMGSASVTIHGTYSGIAGIFELSDDNQVTWYATTCSRVDIAQWESVTGTIPNNTLRMWDCGVFGATHIRFRASAFSTGTGVVNISPSAVPIEPALTVALANAAGSTSDPCQNPSVPKKSAKITLTSTTAQELVTLAAGQSIYACGFVATIQGSATTVGTLQFEYGTKTTNGCDTGTTTLTDVFQGNITANVPTVVASPGGMTQFSTASGNELCAVATGTTISVKGYLTYVQQP